MREEFLEIKKFYAGFEGRRLMMKEGKLVYRTSFQKVCRGDKVNRVISDSFNLAFPLTTGSE